MEEWLSKDIWTVSQEKNKNVVYKTRIFLKSTLRGINKLDLL